MKKRITELEVTESKLKQVEKALRESEENFRRSLDDSPLGARIVSATGETIYANRALLDMYDYKDIGELQTTSTKMRYTPESYAEFLDRREKRQRGEFVPSEYEISIIRKDGDIRRLQVFRKEILWNGAPQFQTIYNDITARKEVDQALRESEEIYRTLVETSPDPILMYSLDGTIISANNRIARAYGTAGVAEFLQEVKTIFNLLTEDSKADAAAALHRTISQGYAQKNEYQVRIRNGKTIPVEMNSSVVWTEKGQPKAIISVLRNIQERKEAAEALRASETRYQTIFANTGTVMLLIEEDMTISFVNAEFEKLTGYRREEIEGKKRWTEFVDKSNLEKMIRQHWLRRSDPSQAKRSYEFRLMHKDGLLRDFLLTVDVIPGTKMSIASLIDITERKQAEEAVKKSEENYRLLFESAGEGILIAQDDKIQIANPALVEILGYPKDIITSRPFTSFIHPDDRQKVLDYHLRRLKGEPMPTGHTFRIVTADGTEKWLQIKPKLISWNGNPASLTFVENITDRRQMESQLIQAQKLEAIGTLAGGMAHNFNNILTGIQGYASLMLMGMKQDHPHYERLKSIEAQIRSGAELTRQLLGFARGGQYETKLLDINQVLSRSATLFGKAQKEVVMSLNLLNGSMTVLADQNQMEQVFLNLFMNAAQAMPSGGNIDLETQRVFLSDTYMHPFEVAPGAYVKITVTDTGVGMDEKTRERIFEPFFTTKQMGRGTGLGLATVYGIVKGHKGYITVDSTLERGTTFTIYLPASEQEIVKEKAASSEILTGTETILVVDDEEVVLEISKEFLESLGYRVYSAGSGQEAMAVYLEKQNEIDLVILDMILPGLSGGDTFDRLRTINPEIRVLLSSGYSINGKAQQILNRGCNGFIQKPFRLEMLSQKVREILKGLPGPHQP